ncbi:MAG: YjbH domain-containing protein [Armatimonadetes bacterium]|nr:YjbH domain-containing protein [Armatimonadota bacterium]
MTRAKMTALVLMSAALALCCLSAHASPTALGPTGLLTTPTADVEDMANVQLGGWWVSDWGESASLTGGAGMNGEANISWINPETGGDEVIFSSKWRFRQNNLTQPAVAVGIIDFTDRMELTPYIVVQKGFDLAGFGVTASAGYAKPNSLLDGFFGGADVKLADKLHLLGEWDGNDLNAGVRFPFKDRFEFTAGMVKDEFAASAMYRIR